MTDLSQQTEQLLKVLNTLHQDLAAIYITLCFATGLIAAHAIISIFRRWSIHQETPDFGGVGMVNGVWLGLRVHQTDVEVGVDQEDTGKILTLRLKQNSLLRFFLKPTTKQDSFQLLTHRLSLAGIAANRSRRTRFYASNISWTYSPIYSQS